MMFPPIRKNNGSSIFRTLLLFKMLELMVVLLVLSVLYDALISRVMDYHADYEVAEVNWTISMLRSARRTELVQDEINRALGRIDKRAAQKLRSRNPMLTLQPLPRNYIGELCDPDPLAVQGGSWYFDRCNNWLVHVSTSEKIFAREHPKVLKFNVESLRLLTDPA